jgi:hypothetical protein
MDIEDKTTRICSAARMQFVIVDFERTPVPLLKTLSSKPLEPAGTREGTGRKFGSS